MRFGRVSADKVHNEYVHVPRVAPVMRTLCPESEKSWGDGTLGEALMWGVKLRWIS